VIGRGDTDIPPRPSLTHCELALACVASAPIIVSCAHPSFASLPSVSSLRVLSAMPRPFSSLAPSPCYTAISVGTVGTPPVLASLNLTQFASIQL
jgi:hypothetical protein